MEFAVRKTFTFGSIRAIPATHRDLILGVQGSRDQGSGVLSAKERRRRLHGGKQIRKADSGPVGNVLARAKCTSHPSCALLIILLAFSSMCAWSQTQLATVSGTITDPSGAVVPGVSVTIVSQGTGLKRSALTDTAGEYRFAGLPTGNYSLRIEKTGFQSQIREGVELTSAAEVTINSQLAIGDLSQQTTVSANVAGIDSTTSTSRWTTSGAEPDGTAPRQPRSF